MNMEKKTNILDNKKFQVLLHENECLNNRVMSCVRLYYDVGIVIASSVVLLGIYSVVNRKYSLFLAIPLLIVLGEIFYLYLTHIVMRFEWYMIDNIETNFDNMIEEDVLDMTRKIGIFRKFINQDKDAVRHFYAKKCIPYLLGYIIFFIGALFLNLGKTFKINSIPMGIETIELGIVECSTGIYFFILLLLIVAILWICKEYKDYSEEIKSLIKKTMKK